MNNRSSLPITTDHQKRRSDSCASWASLQFSMDYQHSEASSHERPESFERSSLYQRSNGGLSNILDQVSRLSLEPPSDLSAMKTPENGGRPVLSLSDEKHDFTSRELYNLYRRFDAPMMMDAPLIPDSPDLSIVDAGDRPAVGAHRVPLLQPFFSPIHNRNLMNVGAARYAQQFCQSNESRPETSSFLWASPKSISSAPPPPMPIFAASPGQNENIKPVVPQLVNALKMRKGAISMELS